MFAHIKGFNASSSALREHQMLFDLCSSHQISSLGAVCVLCAKPPSQLTRRLRRHFIFRNKEYYPSLDELLLSVCVAYYSPSPSQPLFNAGQKPLSYYLGSQGPSAGTEDLSLLAVCQDNGGGQDL